MKILIFIISLALISSSNAFADFADDVEQKYNGLSSWQSAFIQTTHVEMLKQNLTKNGKISVLRPNQIRIEYQTKPEKIYASNGKKLWVYKKNDDTAFQFDKPKEVISKEAWSFLSGLQNLSKIFDIQYVGTEPKGPLKITERRLKKLFLQPKNNDAVVRSITLGVDRRTLIVKEAVLLNISGNLTHYKFSDHFFDEKLKNDLFTLPKKPKRKIIKQ